MTGQQPTAKAPKDTRTIKQILDDSAARAQRTAQLIVFLDPQGNPHAELPGDNGARIKVYLSDDFAARNPELMTALYDARARNAAQAKHIAEAAERRGTYVDPEIARRQRNEEIARNKKIEFAAWLDSLSAERRAAEEQKLAEREQRAKDRQAEQARQLWTLTAENHSVNLANKVIPDPKRRPRRKVAVGIYKISPQNDKAMTAALNGETAAPRKRKTPTNATIFEL